MSLLSNSNAIPSTGGAYNITDSLRFRSSASANLSRDYFGQGNDSNTTYTISAWIKFNPTSSHTQAIYSGSIGTTNSRTLFYLDAGNDQLRFLQALAGSNRILIQSSNALRDPSAWYHVMVVVDTTQATSTDRAKLYINGEEVSSYSSYTVPAQNTAVPVANWTSSWTHAIGSDTANSANKFDGYMTEFHLIDGQALTPSDFGETNNYGVWQPIEYTGTYGTNGFYLPMKETTQVEGFNTLTYQGNGTSQVLDTGFVNYADLIWIKDRDNASNHILANPQIGHSKYLSSNTTTGDTTDATTITGFNKGTNSLGVGLGSSSLVNGSGRDYVAWCWGGDAGTSTVSNTDGSITSTVRANPATGFSTVRWTGDGTGATIGHGLSSAPKMYIVKNRNNSSTDWLVYHESTGATQRNTLNSTSAAFTSSNFNNTAPTSSVFSVGTATSANGSGNNMIAFCFSEVSGYSKFGSYTGTGVAGNTVSGLGFRPAFLMVKRTDSAGGWVMMDNTRTPDKFNRWVVAENSAAENSTTDFFEVNDDGFSIEYTGAFNASGSPYIYMAFADTRDYQWNFDSSGNKNNWTPNNINSNASSETTYDLMSDTPSLADEDTGNFATWNPLSETSNLSTSEANLAVANSTTESTHRLIRGTIGMSTGKYYWEVNVNNSAQVDMVGIINSSYTGTDAATVNASNGFGYGYSTSTGNWYTGGGWTNDGTTPSGFPSSGIIGVAFDADNGKLYFSRNNTWINSANPSAGTGANATYTGSETEFLPALSIYYNTGTWRVNFGQRPFAYTPPTGFKKLNTFNLPNSSITDGSEYFDAVTYTGNGIAVASGGNSITSLEFQPDFVWIKDRTSPYHHNISDVIRGASTRVYSSLTNAEDTNTESVNSFDSNGFTVGNNVGVNTSSNAYVAWNWRANGSGVSNTDGTITSTVSANTDSGFSIVTFTGTGAGATVGHGLSQAPEVYIRKSRSNAEDWFVYTTVIDGSLDYLNLNATSAKSNSGASLPTATTFEVGAGESSGEELVTYCFHSVEGFSKFGTYTGNGSADGPFVYTGFRPAFVMIKKSSSTGNWLIHDSKREQDNPVNHTLYPNLSSAELGSGGLIDFLSNGFKKTYNDSDSNASGATFIYMAFAENPFKNSLAR